MSKYHIGKYAVTVGNIGQVYMGDSKIDALINFDHYKTLSEQQCGRASDETVTLWENGEPVEEHYPASCFE